MKSVRQSSHIPVIVLGAGIDRGNGVKCLDFGDDDYITKLFGVDELLTRINAINRHNKPVEQVEMKSPVICYTLELNKMNEEYLFQR